MVHVMSSMMSKVFSIEDSSRLNLHLQLSQSREKPYPEYSTPRVGVRQIKFVLYNMIQMLTKEILKQYERLLTSDYARSWTTCVCLHMLFCLLVERSQIAADLFVKSGIEPELSENDSGQFCTTLDDRLISVTEMFHHRYGSSLEHGFNPVRDEFDKTTPKSAVNLADGIRAIALQS